MIEIRIAKGVLFLTELELISVLPAELVELGLRRGKGIIRARRLQKRISEASNSYKCRLDKELGVAL